MELVALTGKPKSGKTTLAKALEKQGYTVINFTDVLKEEAYKILEPYGCVNTVEDISRNKEKYRGFLQELGSHIGFDTERQWVTEAILEWKMSCKWVEHTVPAVFDNVRTPQQWEVLKSYGFKLVRLASFRSEDNRHPIESALDHIQADLALNGDLEVEYLVWKVLNF